MQRNRKSVASIQEKKKKHQSIETVLEKTQMLDLLDKYFKLGIIYMFKELKETL